MFLIKSSLACLVAFTCLCHHLQARPNVILMMADDMGYECLSANGSADYETPTLDKLAKEGIRFEHCYSTPLCTPSRVQIMTGKYNHSNYKEFGYLDPKEKTFGKLMQEAGYKTCIAGKWQLNGLYHEDQFPEEFRMDTTVPLKAGFDEACLWQVTQAKTKGKGERFADPLIEKNGEVLGTLEGEYGPDVFADFICDFIDRQKDEEFFVYYPMVLVHNPFVPTPDSPEWENPKLRHKQKNEFFKDMVAYTDGVVAKLVAKLEEHGLMENTILLFTGDNGTNRAITSTMQDGSTIKGGKGTTPNAGTHVPFVAHWRGTTPSVVNQDLIDFTDFYQTLADVAGVDVSAENLPGHSFFPQLKGETGNPREWVYCHYEPRWGKFTLARFARDHHYKLYQDGSFYDLTTDEEEKNPLPPSEETAAVRARLQAVLDSMPPIVERPYEEPAKKKAQKE